jgi:hypothetical protein
MFWRGLFGHRYESSAALFRRVHEAWLDRALRTGQAYPRIPLRRVDRGGFDLLRARAGGAARAETWWRLALGRVDSDAA